MASVWVLPGDVGPSNCTRWQFIKSHNVHICDNLLSLNCQSICISCLDDGEADVEVDGCGLMVDPLPTGPTSCGDDFTELDVDTYHGLKIQFAIVTSIETGVTVSSS